jgi:hypothetical protein
MKLNGATIPDVIVQRVIQRRGTEHSFAVLNPGSPAAEFFRDQAAEQRRLLG